MLFKRRLASAAGIVALLAAGARTTVKRGSAETEFHRRGTAFRIPGMLVDGMDVLAVKAR